MPDTHLTDLARQLRKPQVSFSITKSDRTRAAILEAALEFLWERPFRDMTVAKLTSALGISRPTFYQYFPSVHGLMEALLLDLQDDILDRASPWFTGTGDVRQLLLDSLSGLVQASYEQGPVLRAVADAAPNDPQLEAIWHAFLERFDDAVASRIEVDQAAGLIPELDARGVAMSFTRMDAYTFVHAFGNHPRQKPETVLASISLIWTSTLYPGKRLLRRR